MSGQPLSNAAKMGFHASDLIAANDRLRVENARLREMVAKYVDRAAVKDTGFDGYTRSMVVHDLFWDNELTSPQPR